MMIHILKSICKRPSLPLVTVLIAFVSLAYMGCSYRKTVDKTTETVTKTTQKISRNIRFSDDDLQRMTTVIGFENKSLYRGQDFTQLFRKGIPEYLNNECDDVSVPDPDSAKNVAGFQQLPLLENGQVDNYALALIGRQLGLNAIITGSLDDIGILDELRGMIWKDTHHLIQILASVEVYDTESGSKILDESFSRKVEIEELDYELMRSEGKMILPDLNETLTDLLGEIGETICWAIEDQAWSGFVIAVEDDTLTLSAGSDAGLAPGDEFHVYDTSRVLKGLSGQRFFVRGQKIGEIKITEVEADKARAVIVTNRGIKPGSSVRVK
ncbi:MAG: hypothetical protein PVJ41_11135 [Desulfobacterales bacterium]|jgi:hypothetical protein